MYLARPLGVRGQIKNETGHASEPRRGGIRGPGTLAQREEPRLAAPIGNTWPLGTSPANRPLPAPQRARAATPKKSLTSRSALGGLSEAWTEFICLLCPNSARTV